MFFTVIIPVLNGEQFIRRAIERIFAQSCTPIQILAFDGGSTDLTLDILGEYPSVSVISGSDLGPHDAMNNAIKAAQGVVIAFLNSDDFFAKDIFQEVKQTFIQEPHLDIVGGGSFTSTQYQCDQIGGVWHENTQCDEEPVPCSTNADCPETCCLMDGTCADNVED